ncbi:site-specific DNA-methyltransferase [Vibrio harveyi]|uniref:site-specific DNA-methyltransferase n=1 Tax=Vibrio harveyi TaxID=669 RepID=UPI0031BB67E7
MNKEKLFSDAETANSKQLEILQKHFPQCFDKQGNFIQEKMLEVVQASEVELSKESYSLNWLGKSYARLLTNLPPKTLLHEDKEHNQLDANKDSQNLLIKGDNLEVLKHMVNAYSEKIKMIYIDPPYNTGSDGFVYNDDRKFTPQQLSELAGIDLDEAKRILDFTEKGSSSHSAWLTFMYPRLYVARELLNEDGVIFISIDDNEQSQLKVLCDEIFGESNFLENFIWKSGRTSSSIYTREHEYIIAYAKNKTHLKHIEHVGENDIISDRAIKKISVKNPASEIKFPAGLRFKGTDKIFPKEFGKGEKVQVIDGVFECKNGKLANDVVLKAGWTMKNQVERFLSGQEVTDTKGQKVVGFHFKENGLLQYEKIRSTIHPTTIINEFSTKQGSMQLSQLLSEGVFSYPKPTSLINFLMQIVEPNSIVIDFFAGSGSTAHAVFELNQLSMKNCQFISIQIPEKTHSADNAYKAGYRSIFEITKDRLQKASEKIKQDNPDYKGDLGFKIFETVEDFRVKDEAELTLENHSFFDDAVLSDEQYQTLLTTWCAYDGSLLTTPVHDVDLNGYTAHICDKRLYLIAPNFNSETVKALLNELDNNDDFEPNKVVFYGNNFDSAKQMELNEALKGYANKKSIELDLVVRN